MIKRRYYVTTTTTSLGPPPRTVLLQDQSFLELIGAVIEVIHRGESQFVLLFIWRIAKPHENICSPFKDLPHPNNLRAALLLRTLVNANRIDPNVSTNKLRPENLMQSNVQVMANLKMMLIYRDREDFGGQYTWIPLVRKSSISRL